MGTSEHQGRANELGPPSPERRAFLTKLSLALGGVGAVVVGAPFLSFLLAPLLRRAPETWASVGPVSRFEIGRTVEVAFVDPSPLPWAGLAAKTALWLRRVSADEFVAFSVHCTHLGCPVRWVDTAELFMCPCHGGVFYPNGAVAAGPPSEPLHRYPTRIRRGVVEVLANPNAANGKGGA
jgi:menaquinol-cytochrome c reductase iron-sulfur subunit